METIGGEQVATNPTTGQKVVFRGGSWVPYTPKVAAPPSRLTSPIASPTATPTPDWWGRNIAQPLTKGMQQMAGVPPGLTKSIFPQTGTQAATDVGMVGANMLLPGSDVLPALGRTAVVGGVGALANAVQGKDPIMGGISGAAQQGLGEVASPILNLMGRYGGKKLNALKGSAIGEWLSSKIPALKKFDFSSSLGYDRAFRSKGQGLDYVDATDRRPAEDAARQLAGNRLIPMPSLKSNLSSGPYQISFDDALSAIRRLDDTSHWTMADDSAARLIAKQHRRMAFGAKQDLQAALNQMKPGAGDEFMAAQRRFATTAVLHNLFTSEKELMPRKGGVDWARIKELAENGGTQGYRDDLERVLGPDGVEELLTKLSWGERTTAADVPAGLNLRVGIHGTGLPGIYMHPSLGSRVGVPPRRLPKIPPALSALVIGQGTGLGDALNEGDQ